MESARDGSGRLFVIEQAGRHPHHPQRRSHGDSVPGHQAKVASGGELGLLGLAFHPAYTTNRKFYVDDTRPLGSLWETVIAEYLAQLLIPTRPMPPASASC